MAATQTTTIETVSVVRPLKVISLICLCIAIALSIVSLCSTWWLRSGYIKAVAALMIIALIFTAVAFFLNICGLSKSDIRRKYIFYKFATYLAILAVLLELTALIVFPACFYVKMKEYGSRRDWEVDWSYGLAWGATLFTFGASLLLICDKEHEEVYYKEKTIYNPPPELMN
ncbi:unnamed protein product [Nippostrongylus brasiliensis]|uniref:Cell junction protein VAB-9 (inferred by orthology to a C. elegans protein) n=1 Tax=Nippostrongylus brasiliensis TaxID=27835 RepID=A0A0N4XYG8_NIPBR|nr:unnamed protein product [Nippostrongylus brasiliensis]